MNRGELTGQLFGLTKLDVGMPFRSEHVSKRNERKNYSSLDDDVNINQLRDNPEPENDVKFHYFDPSMSSIGQSEFQPLTTGREAKFNEIDERGIQNINSVNSDYINAIAFNIYNGFSKLTSNDFCVFPIGIMRSLIEKDASINKILAQINNTEMFHQIRGGQNSIISRTSSIISIDTSYIKNKINYYEDNDNMVIEFPMNNTNFAFGIICDRDKGSINLNSKLFSSYMMNIKKTHVNVYIPQFKISNKLNATGILKSLGYIREGQTQYIQSLHFELPNNIYIKNTLGRPLINLENNFIYYIRYVPNNVILFIGRHQ